MFKLNHIYTLDDILKYVKKSYPIEKRDMFDDYYVYQALDELIPITNNDFNNFKDTLMDKYNRAGYLIYIKNYYIFQPFDENEDLPMYYRRNYTSTIQNNLNLKDFIKNLAEFKNIKHISKTNKFTKATEKITHKNYDFDSIQEYYDSREEFDYVGIVDQESARKKIGDAAQLGDEFKIRAKRPKILAKKRETGVPSFKGAVCRTSKDKQFLAIIATKLNLTIEDANIRDNICNLVRDKLYDMEKYSRTADKNKMTYLIVPANHPTIPFSLNLEDRIKHILNQIKQETRSSIEPKIETTKKTGRFTDVKYISYKLVFDKNMDKYSDLLVSTGATKVGTNWVINVD